MFFRAGLITMWPNKFEIYRRATMSPSMITMRVRLQKEGEVIHIICDRILNQDDMLRLIGRTEFTGTPGPGDGEPHGGGPAPRDSGIPRGRTLASPPLGAPVTWNGDEEKLPQIRSDDFH